MLDFSEWVLQERRKGKEAERKREAGVKSEGGNKVEERIDMTKEKGQTRQKRLGVGMDRAMIPLDDAQALKCDARLEHLVTCSVKNKDLFCIFVSLLSLKTASFLLTMTPNYPELHNSTNNHP